MVMQKTAEFCMNMQAHWNDGDIREAIDSF